SAGAVSAGAPKQKLEFVYDYKGRRVQKRVYDWDSGLGNWENAPATLRYLYDGWNLIAEIGDGDALIRQHVWGLDLTDDFQAAGGVGALLATADVNGAYYAAYDGNGNITGMVDSLSAAPVARYEYSPFGQPLRQTGKLAGVLPFGFSTKYVDAESNLVYY